jgi:hypothetical protein
VILPVFVLFTDTPGFFTVTPGFFTESGIDAGRKTGSSKLKIVFKSELKII